MDVHDSKTRSYNMSRIRGHNTKPEILFRRALWGAGFRYRLHSKLPGKPDICFISKKIVVFIDGCFWHRCPVHYVAPRTRSDFWEKKVAENVARDEKINVKLISEGWTVLRFWEHEVKENTDICVKKLTKYIK